MTIGVRWGAATDAGRVRELNEDSHLAAPPVFAVADGVGGHAAGEVASAIAVAGLDRFNGSQAVAAPSVLDAVRAANDEIRSQARAAAAEKGMGSTVVGLALSWSGSGDTLLVFNVGDSRGFRLSRDQLVQVTMDHSLVDELLRAGQITAEEARTHPKRSVITRALGAADSVDVDSWQLDAVVGDRFLLCSDGLTNEVAVADLHRVLLSVEDPQEAARQLVALAVTNGGRDNVTAVVVDVDAVAPSGDRSDALRAGAADDAGRVAPTLTLPVVGGA